MLIPGIEAYLGESAVVIAFLRLGILIVECVGIHLCLSVGYGNLFQQRLFAVRTVAYVNDIDVVSVDVGKCHVESRRDVVGFVSRVSDLVELVSVCFF